MTIEQFIKERGPRLQNGDTWMVWDSGYGTGEWVVYNHPYGAEKNKVLHHGDNTEDALAAFRESRPQ
mgnify:CR=1 FL=1